MSDPYGGQPIVAINGRATARAEIGGVERYAVNLSDGMRRLRPGRYRTIVPPPVLAHRLGHLWEQGALPAIARRCALLYSPANLAPVAFRRNVVVIHDVAALAHPEAYSAAYVRYQRSILPAIARRARLVITVSEFSRGEIVELLGVRANAIEVVSGGVDDRFAPDADAAGAARALGITRPYVLVVGTQSVRKNLSMLRAAARALRERGVDLLLAGSARTYLCGGELPDVVHLGYVPDELLPGLYAGARALVMPSLHEGFGLPCLEAMACGVPVVAANAGALPGTCGDAALLVDPHAGDAIAEAVVSALQDDGQRSRLIAAGLERAARFPWSRAVNETDDAISALLAGGTTGPVPGRS